MFSWYRHITPRERKTFWACFGGWSLDALEVQMFGLAIPALIAAFALTKGDAGLISGVTLVTSGTGGIFAPGVLVARVAQAGSDSAPAAPLAHPDTFDFAIVSAPFLPPPPPPPSVKSATSAAGTTP